MPEPVDPSTELYQLAALGSATAIAEKMRAENILGLRGDACRCPVSRYLNRKLGVTYAVGTTEVAQMVNNDESSDDRWPLPPVVTRFIRDFDGHRYPELEAE